MEFLDKIRLKLKEKSEAYFDIRVRPNANISQIIGEMTDGTVKIDLAAKPVKGEANQELIKFLAKELAVSAPSIKILAGKTGKNKLVKIKL
jgi:uncharacterized protein (TIGR00251 family)